MQRRLSPAADMPVTRLRAAIRPVQASALAWVPRRAEEEKLRVVNRIGRANCVEHFACCPELMRASACATMPANNATVLTGI